MSQRPGIIAKVVTAVTIAAAAIGIAPAVAEAQGRGIMQVSANVVSMDHSLRTLAAARAAATSATQPRAVQGVVTAPTVARVSVARDPKAVIVTIDYSRS